MVFGRAFQSKPITQAHDQEEELSLLNSANSISSHHEQPSAYDHIPCPLPEPNLRIRRRNGFGQSTRVRVRRLALGIGLTILTIFAGSFLITRFSPGIIHSTLLSTLAASDHPNLELDWSLSSPRSPRTFDNGFGFRPPPLGSSQWKKLYPPARPSGPEPHPHWVSRYTHLLSLSSANDTSSPLSSSYSVPQATLSHVNGLAEYPSGTRLGTEPGGICSYRRTSCLRGPKEDGGMGLEDVWMGLPGTWAINFDDGPLPPSASLYTFLTTKNQTATHFWIGANVRDHHQLALQAHSRRDHLAVHTWSHAHLTTLDDMQILGELGWTIQIIYDLTGLVPLYYRPPYGDVDNRVRALAKHVFGLTTLMWNCDSSDWTLNQTHAIGDFVDPPMGGFGIPQAVDQIKAQAHVPASQQTQGRIILEHELSEESVKAFELTFDLVKASGYQTGTVAECLNANQYQPSPPQTWL